MIKKNNNEKLYFGFYTKIFIRIIIFMLLLGSSLIFINLSLKKIDVKFSYNENGNIDYNVYLKKNDYYSEKYLPKDMTYIASLIDYIDLNYNYSLSSKSYIAGKYKTYIDANLIIYSANDSKNIVFSKKYNLLDNEFDLFDKTKKYNKNQNIKLDYNYYNGLATSFKNKYCMDCESKLVVSISNNLLGLSLDEEIDFSNNNSTEIEIPISTKQVNIKISSNNLNDKNTLINEKSNFINSKIIFGIGIGCGVLSIVFVILIANLLNKIIPRKNKYKKAINKILKQYDRAIVESNVVPNFDEFEVIKVTKFGELLDVRDNLKIPIIYSKINSEKCCFYVRDENIIYIYYLKSADL